MQTSHRKQSIDIPLWVKLLAAVVALIVLVLGVLFVMGVAATRRWNGYTKSLRDRGQAVTLAEIEARRPSIADESNSALLVQRIGRDFGELLNEKAPPEVLVFGRSSNFVDGIERGRIEVSREYLKGRQGMLVELGAIRGLDAGRFPLDLDRPVIEILLPNLSPLRQLGKLANLAATLSLVDGRLDEAGGWAVVQFQLAGSLDGDPMLISRLTQIGIEQLAAHSMEECLAAGELSVVVLEELAVSLDRRLARSAIQRAIAGERAMFIDTCDCILDGRLTTTSLASVPVAPPPWWAAIVKLPVWVVRMNQIQGTEMLTWLVDAGEDAAALREAGARLDAKVPKLPPLHTVVRIMMPSLSRAVTLHIRSVGGLRAARAVVAAEMYRMKTGRLPDELDELVPEFLERVPVDPFDGQALRLRKTEKGIVIYSIGEDMADGEGDVAFQGNKRPGDVGFRLWRLEERGVRIVDTPAEERP